MYIYVFSGLQESVSALGDNETGCFAYLSGFCVAAQEYQCTLPFFLPIGRPCTLIFLGSHHHDRQHHHNLVRYICDFTNRRWHSNAHFEVLLSMLNEITMSTLVHFASTFKLRRAYQFHQGYYLIIAGCDSHLHRMRLKRGLCLLHRHLIGSRRAYPLPTFHLFMWPSQQWHHFHRCHPTSTTIGQQFISTEVSSCNPTKHHAGACYAHNTRLH